MWESLEQLKRKRSRYRVNREKMTGPSWTEHLKQCSKEYHARKAKAKKVPQSPKRRLRGKTEVTPRRRAQGKQTDPARDLN